MSEALASIERAAAVLRIELPRGAAEQFQAYVHEVLVWRRRINLTSASTAHELVTQHLIDSLLPLTVVHFPLAGRAADVGSGAGFPGVPIKLVRPDLQLTLVEASRRRVAFLEHLSTRLALPDVEVVWGRAEVLGREQPWREAFGVVLSRAAARASAAAELCLPLASTGGAVVLLKGPHAGPEVAAAQPLIRALGGETEATHTRDLPLTEQQRLLVVIRKVRSCSSRFPRSGRQLGRAP